jgi:AraC-like DNA-binding protein
MGSVMHPTRQGRLERSCTTGGRDWIRAAPSQPRFERIEAFFSGHGYDPHRHDTYAVGLTLGGVQSFDYRGATLHSTRGKAVILYPDETHDGRAGSETGFHYRMAYIEPRLIQDALGRRPLPFVRDAVTSDARLIAAIAPAIEDLDLPLDELQRDQSVLAVCEALAALEGTLPDTIRVACWRAVARARDYLDANAGRVVTSAQLESASGLSRFALARHFRACLGTSPYRYLVLRRLDSARRSMLGGASLAEAAAASGFADQSHMTRQFRRAFGVSPGRWRRMVATGP